MKGVNRKIARNKLEDQGLSSLRGTKGLRHEEDQRSRFVLAHTCQWEASLSPLKSSEPQREVSFTIAPNLVVEGDRVLLRSALENLLSNAWKFGRRGDF
jgi:signal transduction histidine kinase